SYNMSKAADGSNGENLMVIRDRRVATSYMIEAVRIIDHYQFRAGQADAKKKRTSLMLQRPPKAPGDTPWWDKDYKEPHRIKDRREPKHNGPSGILNPAALRSGRGSRGPRFRR